MTATEINQDVAARVAAVRGRIAGVCARAGRDPATVTLVAVSKTFTAERIRPALDAGVTDLGENRVQEAEEKVGDLPSDGVHWHLIGHLQRNKVNKALAIFSLIHSVDTVELARAIAARAQNQGGGPVRVLLQANLAEKESQFGFPEAGIAAAAASLAGLPGLAIEGLMCIAPEVDDVEGTRPYFRRLAGMFGDLRATMAAAGHPWRHLSMGMSGDYPVAIEEGATLVRVGRAIFGERAAVPVAAPEGR